MGRAGKISEMLCVIVLFLPAVPIKALPPGLIDTLNNYLGPQQHYAQNSPQPYQSQPAYQSFYSPPSQFNNQFQPPEEPQKTDDSERGFFENTITKWKTKFMGEVITQAVQRFLSYLLESVGLKDVVQNKPPPQNAAVFNILRKINDDDRD